VVEELAVLDIDPEFGLPEVEGVHWAGVVKQVLSQKVLDEPVWTLYPIWVRVLL
jgi:hypothetical protein